MSTHTASDKSSNSKSITQVGSNSENNLEQKTASLDAVNEGERAEAHLLSFSDIESVDQLRDELSLQAHLLRSELKDRFEKLEKEWPVLDVHIEPIRKATTQAGADVTAAVRLLFDTIKESYQDIKNSTTSRH